MVMASSLRAAMEQLAKNYKKVLQGAVQHASAEAQNDIYEKALSCLEEYYGSYSPRRYGRSGSLGNAFLPFMKMSGGGDFIVVNVGVEYDAGALTGVYSASKKYGTADPGWVLDNYLDGIHPTTDGSTVPGEAQYIPIYGPSPTETMTAFLNEYGNTFEANVYSYLAAYVVGMM